MLELAAALGLSALPAFAIIAYIYQRDRARPEPLGLIGRSVLYGFVAVAPAAILELILTAILPPIPGILGVLVEAFIVAGLVEESVKLFFVQRYLFRHPEFDERADGVVYAICVSLGFAFVEDFLYGYADFGILLLRAFTAVPLHAIATGVMGYHLGVAKIEGLRRGPAALRGALRRGLGWATLIHGLYDFFILSRGLGGFSGLLVIPLLALGWRVLVRLYRRALAEDEGGRGAAPPYQNQPTPLV